jgi:mycoredoxin
MVVFLLVTAAFSPGNAGSKSSEEPNKKYSNVNVGLYMTEWWGYCRQAREFMRSLGVDFKEYDIEKDRSKRDEMRRKTGGSSGVPVIDVEGTIIRGYDPEEIKAALDKAVR